MKTRLLQRDDLAACLALWPASLRPPLAMLSALQQGLDSGHFMGAVIHSIDNGLLAFGLGGFLSGPALTDYRARPQPGLAAWALARQQRQGDALLSPEQVARAQVADVLHLAILCYRQVSLDPLHPQARAILLAGHAAYRALFEGHHLRSVWQEGEAAEAPYLLAGGYQAKHHHDAASGVVLYGLQRSDLASPWPGDTVSFLFQRHTPRFNFSAAERRVLSLALWQLRDADIARRLGLRDDTVQKTWRQILRRAELEWPDAARAGPGLPSSTRGPERRRHLLDHLRHHLYEVRPVPVGWRR